MTEETATPPLIAQSLEASLTVAQDIDDLASNAKRAGAVLDSEPADAWGVRVFRLRDLDGFRLVISSPRSP